MTKCIVINTYAGSLLLGTRAAGLEPEWSLEDSGYGTEVQRTNFPGLKTCAHWKQWPDLDLRGYVVLAHPPCSWASNMTGGSQERHGTGAGAFECTARVLDYALARNADAVAVESVMPAVDIGRQQHNAYAAKYGYNIFRVAQDAADFGVPQLRERAWFVYARWPRWNVCFRPHRVSIARALLGADEARVEPKKEAWLAEQRKRLEDAGLPANDLLRGAHGFGRLDKLVAKFMGVKREDKTVKGLVLRSSFSSSVCQVLDPDGYATVMLSMAWFLLNGRNLSSEELNRLMGFPDEYRLFPEHKRQEWLSKGVCPPVAEWIARNLTQWTTGTHTVLPGQTLDLRRQGSF